MAQRSRMMIGALGALLVASLAPASAQTAEPSLGCRLFPLACPGPVPAPPPPLLGTPEDQAAAAAPVPAAPVRHAAKHVHHRKHAAAAPAPAAAPQQ